MDVIDDTISKDTKLNDLFENIKLHKKVNYFNSYDCLYGTKGDENAQFIFSKNTISDINNSSGYFISFGDKIKLLYFENGIVKKNIGRIIRKERYEFLMRIFVFLFVYLIISYVSNLLFDENEKKLLGEKISCPNATNPLAVNVHQRPDGKEECVENIIVGPLKCEDISAPHMNVHKGVSLCVPDNFADDLYKMNEIPSSNLGSLGEKIRKYANLRLSGPEILKLRDGFKMESMKQFKNYISSDPLLAPRQIDLYELNRDPLNIAYSNSALSAIYANSYPKDIKNLTSFYM
jgi:hypothetical protein